MFSTSTRQCKLGRTLNLPGGAQALAHAHSANGRQTQVSAHQAGQAFASVFVTGKYCFSALRPILRMREAASPKEAPRPDPLRREPMNFQLYLSRVGLGGIKPLVT